MTDNTALEALVREALNALNWSWQSASDNTLHLPEGWSRRDWIEKAEAALTAAPATPADRHELRPQIDSGELRVTKEGMELVESVGATLDDIVRRNATSTQEGSYDRIKREHPEIVKEAFAAAKRGEGDLPATEPVRCHDCGQIETDHPWGSKVGTVFHCAVFQQAESGGGHD